MSWAIRAKDTNAYFAPCISKGEYGYEFTAVPLWRFVSQEAAQGFWDSMQRVYGVLLQYTCEIVECN